MLLRLLKMLTFCRLEQLFSVNVGVGNPDESICVVCRIIERSCMNDSFALDEPAFATLKLTMLCLTCPLPPYQ